MNEQTVILCSFFLGFFVIDCVSGSATTTLSCTEYGEIGTPHTIRCLPQGDISNGITWNKPGNNGAASCNVDNECIAEDGYNVTVTGNQYTLRINSLKESDAGDWKCRDGGNGVMTKGCNLTISTPADDLKCNISKYNLSTLVLNLEQFYCSAASRFQLINSSNGHLCDVKIQGTMDAGSINGTCKAQSGGTVNAVMSCGNFQINLPCSLSDDVRINDAVLPMIDARFAALTVAVSHLMH